MITIDYYVKLFKDNETYDIFINELRYENLDKAMEHVAKSQWLSSEGYFVLIEKQTHNGSEVDKEIVFIQRKSN